jgi:DNA-binding XRE family transcriptional regulator
MNNAKQKKLARQGWRVGTAADFLGLTPDEAYIVEIRLALASQLKRRRAASMTQAELAQRIQSSQPRVAMAENGSKSVSLDLLMRALLATGATPKDIGQAIAQAA